MGPSTAFFRLLLQNFIRIAGGLWPRLLVRLDGGKMRELTPPVVIGRRQYCVCGIPFDFRPQGCVAGSQLECTGRWRKRRDLELRFRSQAVPAGFTRAASTSLTTTRSGFGIDRTVSMKIAISSTTSCGIVPSTSAS